MGSSGLVRFLPLLRTWAGVADQGLRTAAQWAIALLNDQPRS